MFMQECRILLVQEVGRLDYDDWAYLPFGVGDMIFLAGDGRFTVKGNDGSRIKADDYQAAGSWWADKRLRPSYVYLRLDGMDRVVTIHCLDESSDRKAVWHVYPSRWDGCADVRPIYKITLLIMK